MTTATLKIENLVPAHVLSVYSGKPGCACGCRGKHSYNPEYREEAAKDRGYALESSEINAVQVARVLKLMKARFSDPMTEEECRIASDRTRFSVETDSRLYIVYLREGVRVTTPEQDEVDRQVAAAEGRLAGLRFRAAELRAA